MSAIADCLSLFSLFRFLAGAGTIGCILIRFVYCIEMVVTAHRSPCRYQVSYHCWLGGKFEFLSCGCLEARATYHVSLFIISQE